MWQRWANAKKYYEKCVAREHVVIVSGMQLLRLHSAIRRHHPWGLHRRRRDHEGPRHYRRSVVFCCFTSVGEDRAY